MKTYIVEIPMRGIQTVLVTAPNGKEARRLVNEEYSQHVDRDDKGLIVTADFDINWRGKAGSVLWDGKKAAADEGN